MSDINTGRLLVSKFMEGNNITKEDVAAAYGLKRPWVSKVLNGTDTGPSANKLILTIIRDYRLREEDDSDDT